MSVRIATPPCIVGASLCVALSSAGAAEQAEPKESYHLPRGDAATMLRQFATVSGKPVLFMMDKVQDEQTNAVDGEYSPSEALKIMLDGTILELVKEPTTSGFVVSRRRSPSQHAEVGQDITHQPQTKMKHKKLAVWLLTVLGWVSVPNMPAQTVAPDSSKKQEATETPPRPKAEDKIVQLDTFVVRSGILSSLEDALAAKQTALQFVDAINAEEVGKLPDANVAEALQRITGIQITRNKGEGDFVTVRGLGPNFVRGTVNDRTIVNSAEDYDSTRSGGESYSTGRETNFDILPSTLISQVTVYKTPLASQVEGGMGAVVDVQTQRPLTLGTHAFASVSEMHRDLNGKNDPSFNSLVSWRNDAKNFGILFGVDYNQRTIKEEDPDSFGWWAYGLNVDTTGSGIATNNNVSIPFSFNAVSRNEKRKRLAEQLTAEWILGDKSHLTLDVLHSHRDVKATALGSVPFTTPNILAAGGSFGNRVTNPDGSLQAPGAKVVDNSFTGFDVSNTAYDFTDDQKSTDEVWIAGINYKKTIGEWSLGADLSLADSTGKLNFDRASMDSPLVPFHLTTSNDQLQLAVLSGGPNLGNASLYTLNNADAIFRKNTGKEKAVALDATRYTTNSGFISAFHFGVRLGDRTAERLDDTSYGVSSIQVNAGPLASSMLHYTGNYADGRQVYPLGSFLFPNIAAERAYLLANFPFGANPDGTPKTSGTPTSFTPKFTPQTSYNNDETTYAAFVQADIDMNVGGVPVKGNVGVRAVDTQSTATGYYQPFEIISGNNQGSVVYTSPNYSKITVKNQYSNLLPSLNLNAELAKNLFLRFGTGITMNRPTFSQLAPGITNINPSIRLATTGNPKLKPFESTNFDLGLEWYINKSTAVYGTVFTKSIDQFIGQAVTLDTTYQGVQFNSISQPLNQGKAQISGVEFGYQQTSDFGVGYILNATYMDSSAEYIEGANAGKTISFQGVSKSSYNAVLFYEKHGFSARLAYSYRSSFLVLDSDAFGHQLINAPYGQLDASVSYDLTKRWAVYLNGLNVLNKPDKIYSDIPTRPVSYSVIGKRIQFGTRFRF